MTPDRKHLITTHFNAATTYDSAADLQRRCARLLADKITHTRPTPETILEFGCGTGFLTHHLIEAFPNSTLTATDLSPHMLDRARANLPNTSIQFQQMDAEHPTLSGPFDLITSSLCFQWVSNRPATLRNLSELLSPGGTLIFTTLLQGTLEEWRTACGTDTPCGIPHYPTAQTLQQEWPEGGNGSWTSHTLQDPTPNARTFLKRLRQIGASLPSEGSQPASPHALRRAMHRFDSQHQSVTYTIGLGLFRKDPS